MNFIIENIRTICELWHNSMWTGQRVCYRFSSTVTLLISFSRKQMYCLLSRERRTRRSQRITPNIKIFFSHFLSHNKYLFSIHFSCAPFLSSRFSHSEIKCQTSLVLFFCFHVENAHTFSWIFGSCVKLENWKQITHCGCTFGIWQDKLLLMPQRSPYFMHMSRKKEGKQNGRKFLRMN